MDDNTIITAGYDQQIKFFDKTFFKCQRIVEKAHDDAIIALEKINENHFCSGGKDCYLNVWQFKDFKQILHLKNPDSIFCLLTLNLFT